MGKRPTLRFKGYTEDWEHHKVADHCAMFNGDRSSRYPNADDMVEEGIPFVNAGDLINGTVALNTANKIARTKFNELSGAKLQLGDILYCLRGTLGKNAYIDNFSEGTVASSLVAIRPQNIVGKYLYYILNSDVEYRQRIVHDEGAAQPNLSAKSVSEFIIPVPGIDEQESIAALLTYLDRLITLHQRKYDKLLTYKKAMLEKMFPKDGADVPEVRFAGYTKAWKAYRLSEIATEITRNDPLSNAPIMMITAKDGFIEQSERYAFNNAGESLKKYTLLKKGELAYNHGASKLRPYGSCFALNNAEEARIPFVYHCFSAGDNNSSFLSVQLNGTYIEKQLRRIVSSSARMDGLLNISYEEYATVQIMMPETDEQNKIAEFFHNLDKLISSNVEQVEKLKALKTALLEKMFI